MTVSELLAAQKEFFAQGQTLDLKFRQAALNRLADTISKHEHEILNALWLDLHKSPFESYATEIGFILAEIRETVSKLKQWMRPKRVRTPLFLFGSSSRVVSQPYGVALVIAPWNYPFQLVLSPLVAAVAAGNCAMLKPSPQAVNVAQVLQRIVKEAFDARHVTLLDIPNQAMEDLLTERFDYIFYTGGVDYGRHIMHAAAEHLTPVTLELGGKSPCIVAADAALAISARRIVWGKLLNAGQTCVAPDYILVDRKVKDQLIKELIAEIEKQHGADPKTSPDYGRIISEAHTVRIEQLLACGKVVYGGAVDVVQRYVAPTIMDQVDCESPLMMSEIFGPLLPIIEYDDINQAIDFVNKREKPLALYCFTQSRELARRILRSTSSGGVCVNDTVVQVANSHLPFGGVGQSGMGRYHGRHGFMTFSHLRGVVRSSCRINIGLKFPPYGSKMSLVRRFLR